MVGRVVGDEERLAQQRLTVAPGEFAMEVVALVGDEGFERLAVAR